MLHSFNHYACYYALLCLLHQQQQALSITIIIDGATTSEWATPEEYQRLLETNPQQGAPEPLPNFPQDGGGGGGGRTLSGQSRQEEAIEEAGKLLHRLQLIKQQEESEQQQQQQQQDEPAPESNAPDQIEAALDRLDLIEAAMAKQEKHNHNKQAPIKGKSGARTLSDLVAAGDDGWLNNQASVINQPIGTNANIARIRERESQPRKYCGDDLHDALFYVCRGRFYDGEPIIVSPTIKSRRYIQDSTGNKQQATGGGSRRRKLRTAADSSPANVVDGDGESDMTNHQHNHHYQQTANLMTNNNNERNSNILMNDNKHSRMAALRRRRAEGASQECCSRPCQVEELTKYCLKSNDNMT